MTTTNKFSALGLVAALCLTSVANAQFTVGDSNANWQGFMNVFELPANGGGFVFGSGWGTDDLVSTFDDGANTVTLAPNQINDPNEFWYQNTTGTAPDPMNPGGPGQAGNKIMDANLYVEVTDDALAGQFLTFTGDVVSNSFTSAHTASIFIRDFAPDYSSVNESSIPLAPGPFSVSLLTDPGLGRHIQYGFNVNGENVWSTDVGPFGDAVITTLPVAPPAPFSYSQDFDGLTQSDAAALSDDGWLVYANIFDSGNNYKFEYGGGGAPNDQPSAGFSDLAEGQGAAGAGDQYLNTFSDYNCCDLDMPGSEQGHGNGTDIVQATTYQEYTINSSDVGRTIEFSFDAKLPGGADAAAALGASGSATAEVFMKVLDPANNFSETDKVASDILTQLTGLNDTTWTSHSLSLTITPAMEDQVFQFGVESRSSNFEPTGFYLDNINVNDAAAGVPGDFDGDGFVGLSDLNILGANFPTMGGATVMDGDANGDGNVDLADLNILGANWNPPPAVAVPEPTALALAAFAAAGFLARRK